VSSAWTRLVQKTRWRWLIRLLTDRLRGWELEPASDDLMKEDVLERARSEEGVVVPLNREEEGMSETIEETQGPPADAPEEAPPAEEPPAEPSEGDVDENGDAATSDEDEGGTDEPAA